MNPKLTTVLKITLPLAVLAVGAVAAMTLADMQEPPVTSEVTTRPPLVRVATVTLGTHQMLVESQGTVRPRTESRLVPEVAGRVNWVSPDFVSGGFFEAGEPLLRIDSHDYEQAVVRSRAEVAAAKLRLAQEEAEAEIARAEWEELGEGAPPELTARVPQLDNARAAVAAAEANLVKAQRDLERTELRAPYAGRVRDKAVDVGQFVSRGATLGTVYAIDYAEIRLPLPDQDLAFLTGLPLLYRGDTAGGGPRVVLRAEFAGEVHEWRGRVVRTEGEIDAASRMVHAVARVQDPYGRAAARNRPPLAVGMFVRAEIVGDELDAVAVLPRAAIRDGDRVWTLDADDRLRVREVTVARLEGDRAVVSAGLADGDRVVVSALNVISEGMRVEPSEGPGS